MGLTMSEELFNKIITKLVEMETKQESFATKEDVHASENRLLNHIDSLMKSHTDLDQEYLALRAKTDRHEERLTILEQISQ